MKNIDESNYLQEMFVNQAKPALDRHSGGGEIPEGYIKPSGTKEIATNGTHDVTEYASVEVDVASSGGDTLTEFLSWRNGEHLFDSCSLLTEVPLFDTSVITDANHMFDGCLKITTVPLLDTRNITTMSYMFCNCIVLPAVPLFNTSKVTQMSYMFGGCSKLTTVPLFDTQCVTTMQRMFNACPALTTVPAFDCRNVTNMNGMFYGCSALTTVPAFDVRNVTNLSNMFNNCGALTDIQIRNIKATLTVGSGTSYGHLLTVDSLVNLIYELRNTGSSLTLTVGTANLEKLANVYVKAIDITNEMRAEDDLIDEKYPFIVCESTDEGAMLITTYASTIKNWTIK